MFEQNGLYRIHVTLVDFPDKVENVWRNREKPMNWPFQSSSLTTHLRQISQKIVNDEWKDISSQPSKPFMFTVPLEKYVLAKGGQPIRAMVN